MDVFTKEKRSEIMSNIKSHNTNLEINFLKILSAELYPKGYRYRKHYKKLPGKPDIVFPRYKLAIFLDGDFWHGRNFSKRKTNLPKKYWVDKIQGNVDRDKRHNKELKKMGWTVLRFWEHDIKKDHDKIVQRIEKELINK